MIIDKAYSKEELDNKEIMYIANTNAKNEEFGYNKLKGGSNFDENMREYLSEINFGKHHSEETRKLQSLESHRRHWYNNGKIETFKPECPEGFVPGRLKMK